MKIIKIIIIIIAVIGVGHIICPTSPQYNADNILKKAINRSRTTSFIATIQNTSPFDTDKSNRIYKIKCVKGIFINKALQSTKTLPLTIMSTPLLEGEDIIANRKCWIVRLKPPSKKDPWKQIWVDEKTYVVLAYRDWQDKKVTSSAKMNKITFN